MPQASQFKHEDCVAMLLEHGADPNAMDNTGSTALHYAVWHNSTSMTAKLLAHNADFSIKNEVKRHSFDLHTYVFPTYFKILHWDPDTALT